MLLRFIIRTIFLKNSKYKEEGGIVNRKSKHNLMILLTMMMVLIITGGGYGNSSDYVNAAGTGPKPNGNVDEEVFLGGLFDVKSLEQGKTKYLFVNTIPIDPKITVYSSDSSIVKTSVEDGNGVKLDAIKEGNAQVTVTASYSGMESKTQVIDVQVIKPEYEGSQRIKTNINEDWSFRLEKDIDGEPTNLKDIDFDDSDWDRVSVPHSWNAVDGADGGNDYHKSVGWYRKNITFDKAEYEGKEVFLEFNGTSKVTEVYLNGEKVGKHEGGYSTFRFDVTDKIQLNKNNVLAVSVDNRVNDLMPLSGDFTVFGGMYRDVNIIATDKMHINLMDEGSPGVYWEQKYTLTKEKTRYDDHAELVVKSEIKNDSNEDRNVNIEAIVYDADFKEVKKVVKEDIRISKNDSYNFEEELSVEKPHLWNGTIDPYLYNVVFNVKEGKEIIDTKRDRIGFRFYYIDNNDGFFLNGESYPLHGVNRHQDRKDMGYAISNKEHDEDMAMMDEIGANTIRFAHYQHDQYVYELSDERGIVVWAEIPLVNGIKTTEAFKNNAETNLRELIKQGMNRPSIIMWGLHNEQWPNDHIVPFLENLNELAKSLDPSRLTTLATAQSEDEPLSWVSDVSAWNKYFGLYEAQDIYYFGTWIDKIHEKYPKGKIGMSEYGVGSNLEYHEEDPPDRAPGTSFDSFQTEEFQSKYHEVHWKQIHERPWIWGSYVWNMFEFGSDGRSEAGRKGINNKGLVTYDRKTKKDAFYFYKANWSKEPVVRMTSSRFNDRYQDDIDVKVYSNMENVELFLNGQSLGKVNKADTEYGKFLWEKVKLRMGENNVVAVGTDTNGKTYSDSVTWTRKLHSTPAISSDIAIINEVDPDNRTISKIPADTTIADFPSVVKPLNNSTFEFYNNEGQKILDEDKLVKNGMTLRVISEDKKKFMEYRIVELPISYQKTVTASQIEKNGMEPENAVDGNDKTRWSTKWPGTYPQHIVVDLEDVYNLSGIDSLWYSSADRDYSFHIEVSNDGENFIPITKTQKSGNAEAGWTTTPISDDVTGRYVKVIATDASAAQASASIYELIVQGFKLDSANFKIDNNKREISQIGLQFKNDAESFLENLKISGNFNKIQLKDGETVLTTGTIPENAKLVVTDIKDKKIAYNLNFSDDKFSFGDTDYSINEEKRIISKVPAQISMEQFITELDLKGSYKYKFLLEGSVMDSGAVTEGVQVVLSNIAGNIEKTYIISTIEGSTVPISEGKPVSVSETQKGSGIRNEQSSNPINYINDGNKGTRWAGNTGTAGNTSYFPAEVEFNFGSEYILTAIKIDWFNSSASRAYQYKVDIKPQLGIITKTIDNTNNQTADYTEHIMNINDTQYKVRDVMFTVTGRNTSSPYHVASVYEFKVYGWNLDSDVYTISEKEIKINDNQESLVKFRNNLDIAGNYSLKYLDSKGNELTGDLITSGNQLVITDHENREFVYTIIGEKNPQDPNVSDLKKLVEKYEKEGDFTDDNVAHDLKLHLTAVKRFEDQVNVKKVIKHLKGFKTLLNNFKKKEMITEKAHDDLSSSTDKLIKKWQ